MAVLRESAFMILALLVVCIEMIVELTRQYGLYGYASQSLDEICSAQRWLKEDTDATQH